MHSAAEILALTLLAIGLIVALARVCGRLARRFRQPAVVGEILAGVALGPSLLGAISVGGTTLDEALFPAPVRSQLQALATLGLVIFMFVIGLELDLAGVRAQGRRSVLISVSSVALPLLLGALLSTVLYDRHGGGSSAAAFGLFIGVAMSVTAFPVLARILAERGMHRTSVGALALATAAVDDVLAWSLLAVAVTLSGTAGGIATTVIGSVLFVAITLLLVRRGAALLVDRYRRAGWLTPDIFAAVLVGLILSAYATDKIGIHFIFGAFAFGAIFPRKGAADFVADLLARLEDLSVLVLLPVFFVITGLSIDIRGLDASSLLLIPVVIAVACAGKFISAFATARSLGMGTRRAGVLGVLLNARGLTELIVLNVGFSIGVLDQQLLTVFVIMAIVTTMMTEPLLRWVYPARMVERDIAEAELAGSGEAPTTRVLVALRGTPGDTQAVRVAADLAAEPGRDGHGERGQVLLCRVAGAERPGAELGSGLSVELATLADAVQEGEPLARLVEERGAVAKVITRMTGDAVATWCQQARLHAVDAVLIAGDGPGGSDEVDALLDTCPRRVVVSWPAPADHARSVWLAADGAACPPAVIEVAVRLAVNRGQPLLVGPADHAPTGRAPGWVRRLPTALVQYRTARDADGGLREAALVVRPHAGPPEERPGRSAVWIRPASDELEDTLERYLERLTPIGGDPPAAVAASRPPDPEPGDQSRHRGSAR